MPNLIIRESPKVEATTVRIWEFEEGRYTPQQLLERVKRAREGRGLSLHREKHNAVADDGMISVAALMSNTLTAYQDGKIHAQALGCKSVTAVRTQHELAQELQRKLVSDITSTGRVISVNTIFNSGDVTALSTVTTNATTPSTTQFTANSVTGLLAGDLLRIQLATGYEYGEIQSIATNLITLTAPLSSAPAVGATVNQVIEECGMFGDISSAYTTGTATANGTNGYITGSGTSWSGKTTAGDRFRWAASRTWYTVSNVDSNTQITMTTTPANTSAAAYFFEGTLFNRVNELRLVPTVGKGFIVENQWTMGG